MQETKNSLDEEISFDDLRKNNDLDKDSLTIYLNEIYAQLSESKSKGVSLSRFSDFLTNCPVFVTEKFFHSLTKSSNKEKTHLSYEEFINPVQTLRFGTYEEVLRIIFNIFDFDQDGFINTKDVKLLISFLPLMKEHQQKEYHYQMQSLNELDDIIPLTFTKSSTNISFDEFMSYIDIKANLFLILFCYLYLTIPALDKKLTIYRRKSKKNSLKIYTSEKPNESDKDSVTSSPECSPKINYPGSGKLENAGKKLRMSPSLFSPVSEFRLKHKLTHKEKDSAKVSILEELSKKSKTSKEKVDLKNSLTSIELEAPDTPITASLKNNGVIQIKGNEKSKEIFKAEKDSNASSKAKTSMLNPSSFLKTERYNDKDIKKNSSDLENFLKANNTIIECTEDLFKSNDDIEALLNKQYLFEIDRLEKEKLDLETKEKELRDSIKHEGLLYKYSKINSKYEMKPFYLIVIDQSIYYYRNKDDLKEDYYKSHYLPGCFIREHPKEQIGNSFFHSFSIIFPNTTKRFFHKDYEVIHLWITKLRESIGYKNFFDYFKMGETIGKGQFGVIKSGFDLRTNEKIAIKILTKESIKKTEDWDLIRTEIDIMKHSKHPSIIHYVDHYENSDYIFIVMEFVKSGTLQNYLEKKQFNIGEKLAANIAYQVADALLYLHKYGIIHRDLKPENILIQFTKNINGEDQLELKLMDFGLSKILGNDEKAVEGYGTMAFASPEVISRKPYDDRVDIWSLGVIIYYILSGEIPFMPKSRDFDDMASNIRKQELVFSSKFKTKSPEVANLIQNCLQKKPENRIKIEDLLKHDWFMKFLKIDIRKD